MTRGITLFSRKAKNVSNLQHLLPVAFKIKALRLFNAFLWVVGGAWPNLDWLNETAWFKTLSYRHATVASNRDSCPLCVAVKVHTRVNIADKSVQYNCYRKPVYCDNITQTNKQVGYKTIIIKYSFLKNTINNNSGNELYKTTKACLNRADVNKFWRCWSDRSVKPLWKLCWETFEEPLSKMLHVWTCLIRNMENSSVKQAGEQHKAQNRQMFVRIKGWLQQGLFYIVVHTHTHTC